MDAKMTLFARRAFVGASLLGLVNVAWGEAPELSPSEWLEAALLVNDRAVKGVLSFTRFKDEVYILNSGIEWVPNTGSAFNKVAVPRGFVTDLTSVPRIFFSLFRPDGQYAHAAVVHDYLYWTQATSRAVADEIFYKAMGDLKISPIQQEILAKAVASFGEASWKQNAELKRKGERRVLKLFPDDPLMTWPEWKAKPGVFMDT